jgi:acyl dehydratase
MELSSRFVGTRLKDFRTEVTWRRTMNYAAAVDDHNPCYLNDEREGGILAPPMFATAATWPVLERIWEFIKADDFPAAILATQVHHTEHLAFHRPLKPDQTLTLRGKIAAILPHRSGTRVVVRFDAFDRNGEPIFVEHMGALMRAVTCEDGGRGQEDLPSVPSWQNGEAALWTAPVPIDSLRPFIYDGCTDIVFPIHTSKRFAHQVGLPDIILQGTATLAFAEREIINREADGDPSKLEALACRFTGMVLPGTRIEVRLMGKTERETGTDLHFSVLNQEGRKALSAGYALLRRS